MLEKLLSALWELGPQRPSETRSEGPETNELSRPKSCQLVLTGNLQEVTWSTFTPVNEGVS